MVGENMINVNVKKDVGSLSSEKNQLLVSKILKIMEEKDITPSRLCKDIDIDMGQFSRWYRGKANFSLGKIQYILEYLCHELIIVEKNIHMEHINSNKEDIKENTKDQAVKEVNESNSKKENGPRRVFIKNNLHFKQDIKPGMIFRRRWYYQDENPKELDREIVAVQTNGFWVNERCEEPFKEEKVFVEFKSNEYWRFKDGTLIMIFNHIKDYEEKEKAMRKSEFEKYKIRYKEYIQQLDSMITYDGYKVLGIYEIWTK